MSEEKVMERLQKPWAMKQLVTGKWAAEVREKEERKRQACLEAAAKLIHLYEVVGVPLEELLQSWVDLRQRSCPKGKLPVSNSNTEAAGNP